MKTNSQLEAICGTYSSEDDILYVWNRNNLYVFMFNSMILKSARLKKTAQKYLKEFVEKYNLVKEVDE